MTFGFQGKNLSSILLPAEFNARVSSENTCTPQGLTAYRMRLTFLICCPKPFKCGSTHCRATYLPWVVLHVCPILYQLPGFGEVGSSTWSLFSFHLLKPFLPLVPSTNAASFPAFPYPGNLSFICSVYFIFSLSIIFSFMLFMEEAFSTVLFIIVLQCYVVNLCLTAKWLSYTYISILILIFFSILVCLRILNIVPCAMQ